MVCSDAGIRPAPLKSAGTAVSGRRTRPMTNRCRQAGHILADQRRETGRSLIGAASLSCHRGILYIELEKVGLTFADLSPLPGNEALIRPYRETGSAVGSGAILARRERSSPIKHGWAISANRPPTSRRSAPLSRLSICSRTTLRTLLGSASPLPIKWPRARRRLSRSAAAPSPSAGARLAAEGLRLPCCL